MNIVISHHESFDDFAERDGKVNEKSENCVLFVCNVQIEKG